MRKPLYLLLVMFLATFSSCSNDNNAEWIKGTWIGDWVEYTITDSLVICKDSDGFKFWEEPYTFDKTKNALVLREKLFLINNNGLCIGDKNHPLINVDTYILPDKYIGLIGCWTDGYKTLSFNDDNSVVLSYTDNAAKVWDKIKRANRFDIYDICGKYVVNDKGELIVVWNYDEDKHSTLFGCCDNAEWLILSMQDNETKLSYNGSNARLYHASANSDNLNDLNREAAQYNSRMINHDYYSTANEAYRFSKRPVSSEVSGLSSIQRWDFEITPRVHYQASLQLYDYLDTLSAYSPNMASQIQQAKNIVDDREIKLYIISNPEDIDWAWELAVIEDDNPIGFIDWNCGVIYNSHYGFMTSSRNNVAFWSTWGGSLYDDEEGDFD